MPKLSKLIFLITLIVFSSLIISQKAGAACLNVPISGDYTLSMGEDLGCTFAGTVNGVELGHLTIPEGKTLTINAGQTVIFNPGYSVRIYGSMYMDKTEDGASMRKAYLYMDDADDDIWPDNFTMSWGSTAGAPEGKIRRASTTAYYAGCDTPVDYVADMTCGPGRWLDGSNCTSTAIGYYSPACDNDNLLCTTGHYCPGATDRIVCGSGTYQDQTGQSTCKNCAICTNSGAGPQTSCYTEANNTVCDSCKFCQSGSCVFQYYDSRNDPTNIPTVQIGTQCWMRQSLNVGTEVSGATTQDGYSGTTCTDIEKYRYGTNTLTTNNPNYPDGALYQWNQAMCGNTAEGAQGICPTGWHIPTDPQLKTLVEGQATAGCESSTGWQCSPAGTNLKPNGTSGFEGNLAGSRSTFGSFGNRGTRGGFWSSTQSDAAYAWGRALSSDSATVYRGSYYEAVGFSVRCLKD